MQSLCRHLAAFAESLQPTAVGRGSRPWGIRAIQSISRNCPATSMRAQRHPIFAPLWRPRPTLAAICPHDCRNLGMVKNVQLRVILSQLDGEDEPESRSRQSALNGRSATQYHARTACTQPREGCLLAVKHAGLSPFRAPRRARGTCRRRNDSEPDPQGCEKGLVRPRSAARSSRLRPCCARGKMAQA